MTAINRFHCFRYFITRTVQVREVKKLDSDMQMLVYENYNKFISATDTIRKMAQNVEGMETEMTDLKSSMDRIADSSATVNNSLESEDEKRDKGRQKKSSDKNGVLDSRNKTGRGGQREGQ